GESRRAEHLARNPQGQVPVVQLNDGRYLAQSNAIIRYLARGSSLLPEDAYQQAKVDEWLFWEQYSHEPYVAVCRAQMRYQNRAKQDRDAWRVERAEFALDLMDSELSTRDWLVGRTATIADIALLAYTRLAPQGGFDLSTRTHLTKWVARSEQRFAIGR
ncbi:MAG: glutathione S-transferase, partial [Gammaproteobacteria bacterium]